MLCAEGSDITAWVWVWGTVTNDWSLYMAQVTDSESQLWGTVMIAAWMFVMTISKSWQVFSPINPPFLFFNPSFTFVLKPFKLLSTYIHPFFHFRFLLSHTLFLWRLFQVTFFFILHLVFTFIPYSSLSSLPSPSPSPPPVHFLMLYEVAVIGMHEEHEDVSVQNVWWTCVPLLSFPSHGLHCAGLEERLLTLSPWHNAH